MRARILAVALAAAAVVAVVGCGSPGSSGGTSVEAGKVSMTLTDKPVTLMVWDTENEPGPTAEITKLNAEFEADHPNVTIKRVVRQFNDYTATVKLAASSPHPPDVLQGNEGYSVDGPLVQAGLIAPLDKYAKAYGWESRFGAPSVLDPLRWSADGETWGSGELFGVAQKAEVIGAFYNKATLAKLGLGVPKTFAEFERTLQAAKQAGIPPIMVGDLDQFPLGHIFMVLQSLMAPADEIGDWTFGKEGSTFDTPGTKKALETLQSWSEKGYFESGFDGIAQEDAAGKFAQGEGLYFITGPWENATFEPLGEDLGFFVIPPLESGHATTTGALSLPWHISAKTENPDVAAAYIDFITSPAAAKVVLENGDLPAAKVDAGGLLEPGSSLASILAAWQAKSGNGTLTPYLDWATPSMGETLFGSLQDLATGHASPEDVISRVQDDWQSYQSQK